ncbi:MAG: hypothetical protein GY754_04870 [bacterium]|nr:hypothetical protein [bacterium]
MRKITILILQILLITTLYAQGDKPADKEKTDAPKGTTTETTTDAKKAAPAEEKTNIPDGYGTLKWGFFLSKVKEEIRGTLTFTDNKTKIISKEGEMEYCYGFFYVEPANKDLVKKEDDKKPVPETTPPGATDPAGTPPAKPAETTGEEKDEGKLFYVSLKFPYLSMNEVKEQLKKKYGDPTRENIKNDQGTIAWDSENTIIIMWIDRYEKKPFCRRIIYISKKISKQLNDYQDKVFNKIKLEIIDKMKESL